MDKQFSLSLCCRGLRPGCHLEEDDIVPELAHIHPRERPDWEETISAMVRCTHINRCETVPGPRLDPHCWCVLVLFHFRPNEKSVSVWGHLSACAFNPEGWRVGCCSSVSLSRPIDCWNSIAYSWLMQTSTGLFKLLSFRLFVLISPVVCAHWTPFTTHYHSLFPLLSSSVRVLLLASTAR